VLSAIVTIAVAEFGTVIGAQFAGSRHKPLMPPATQSWASAVPGQLKRNAENNNRERIGTILPNFAFSGSSFDRFSPFTPVAEIV
jgi:hypothetical protein